MGEKEFLGVKGGIFGKNYKKRDPGAWRKKKQVHKVRPINEKDL